MNIFAAAAYAKGALSQALLDSPRRSGMSLNIKLLCAFRNLLFRPNQTPLPASHGIFFLVLYLDKQDAGVRNKALAVMLSD
jgi:hypothetical protein